MNPFLRPSGDGRALPEGWSSKPAGRWAGREVDVAYDRRRHDVAFVRGGVSGDVRRGFRDAGYEPVAADGGTEMWVRDRLAAARSSLDRADRHAALGRDRGTEVGGRGL